MSSKSGNKRLISFSQELRVTSTSTVTQNKDQLDDQAPQSSQEHKDNPSAQKSGHHGLPNKVSSDVLFVIALQWTVGRAMLGAQRSEDEHSLPGDPGTGRFSYPRSEERDEQGKPSEMQANLLHATLRPRAHALGAERAKWGDSPVEWRCRARRARHGL